MSDLPNWTWKTYLRQGIAWNALASCFAFKLGNTHSTGKRHILWSGGLWLLDFRARSECSFWQEPRGDWLGENDVLVWQYETYPSSSFCLHGLDWNLIAQLACVGWQGNHRPNTLGASKQLPSHGQTEAAWQNCQDGLRLSDISHGVALMLVSIERCPSRGRSMTPQSIALGFVPLLGLNTIQK